MHKISELVRRISFLIKGSTLLDRDKSELEDAQKAKEIIDKTTFVEKQILSSNNISMTFLRT